MYIICVYSFRSTSEKENIIVPTDVLGQLATTNALLKNVVKRLEEQEKKISAMEDKVCQSNSSSSGTPRGNRRREVPLEVRVSFLKIINIHHSINFVFEFSCL